MEEIKLPTVPELELIPIERRNFPEEDHKQEKIQHKRKRKRQRCKRSDRSNGCQHDVKRGDGYDHLHLAGRTNLRR